MIKWIFVFVCVLPFMGYTQSNSKRLKNELQLTVGLNSSQAFEFDPSYSLLLPEFMGSNPVVQIDIAVLFHQQLDTQIRQKLLKQNSAPRFIAADTLLLFATLR